jgi:putative transposase
VEYKAGWAGVRMHIANRWYPSSKTCSDCGAVKTTQFLSERTYTCGQCGFTLDRDSNAPRNLAAPVGEVIGGTSSQSCGATVNDPDGNPHQTHTLWACTATGRPTRSTPRRNATATRTERTHIRSQCSGNGDELYNT